MILLPDVPVRSCAGGGGGSPINANAPDSFAPALGAAVVALVRQLGFDGVDADTEVLAGDAVACTNAAPNRACIPSPYIERMRAPCPTACESPQAMVRKVSHIYDLYKEGK